MEYNVQISLTLKDDSRDIASLAEMFPVRPDVVVERGSRSPERNIPRSSYISFYSRAESWSSSMDDHWENFSRMLKENKALFLSVRNTADMKITIAVDHRGRFPSLYIPKGLVAFAADIGSALDVDVYEGDLPS